MIMLNGTIEDGQVKLSQRADLPDGTEVVVMANGLSDTLGIPEEQWPTDPEGIARMLARMDRIEPFDMTAEEEAEVEKWRERVKQYTLAKQDSVLEGLFE
jgi:hypothetical protein